MPVEHVDVLIVGAGLSGIGAGYYLQTRCPGKRYIILEARADLGGTWDLFRYPGVRSDSDMYTLGFSFRPWSGYRSIVDGSSILEYLRSTADEFGIAAHIRFKHRVRSAAWCSAQARWTVQVAVGAQQETRQFSCNFLYLCSGYYSYTGGYDPELPGREAFQGQVVHPQHWPEELDYAGKRVVIIGSGATAVTLAPAMAEKAAHVTLLQRSPSYIVPLPDTDKIALALRRWLPGKLAYRLTRWKNILLSTVFYQFCRRAPHTARLLIRRGVLRLLPPGYPVDTHFNPRYQPWDQRLCVVPDADLFQAIRANRVTIVTDRIATITTSGIRLQSGQELPADVIVTATGLQILPGGGIQLAVDGEQVEPGHTLSYKGVMLSGVPNLAICTGYTNASWTLRAELTSAYVCRLLNYMEQHGYRQCRPRLNHPQQPTKPLLNLSSGYVQRSVDALPKQGVRYPWRMHQNYLLDLLSLRLSPLADGVMSFSRTDTPAPTIDRRIA